MAKAITADDIVELEAVTWEMERRGLIPPDFGCWLDRSRPSMRWDYRHLRHIQRVLDQVTEGELLRVLLQVAGRHGKTETVSSYAAYRIAKQWETRVLWVTYSQPQAHKVSRQIRRMALAQGARISSDRDSAGEWETVEGGGLRALGVGTGTASVNADLIIVDDPIGNRADAESEARRDQVWDSLTTDILARCEPHTAVIFSMPRWHLDDPAGRFQSRQAGRWHVVDMPGRAEAPTKENPWEDVLGRSVGEPLWPELRPASWHDGMRIDLGEYGYSSFIGCRPRPREGGMFKWDWWRELPQVPKAGRMVRYWDLAGTAPKKQGHDPDYTAGALLCRLDDDRTAIVDVARFRESVAKRDAMIIETARDDIRLYRPRLSWWIETEAGISGEERTASLVRKLQALGLAVHTEHPTGSKLLRAEPIASAAESGNVLLCPGEWRDTFRLEAADFTGTGSAHDDQIDAAAGAFAKLGVSVGTWGSGRFSQ